MNQSTNKTCHLLDRAVDMNYLECSKLLPHIESIDIVQAPASSLSWLRAESVQFSSWEIEPGKISYTSATLVILVVRFFCFKIDTYLAIELFTTVSLWKFWKYTIRNRLVKTDEKKYLKSDSTYH